MSQLPGILLVLLVSILGVAIYGKLAKSYCPPGDQTAYRLDDLLARQLYLLDLLGAVKSQLAPPVLVTVPTLTPLLCQLTQWANRQFLTCAQQSMSQCEQLPYVSVRDSLVNETISESLLPAVNCPSMVSSWLRRAHRFTTLYTDHCLS